MIYCQIDSYFELFALLQRYWGKEEVQPHPVCSVQMTVLLVGEACKAHALLQYHCGCWRDLFSLTVPREIPRHVNAQCLVEGAIRLAAW